MHALSRPPVPLPEQYGQKSLDTANRVLGDCDKLGLRIITIQDLDYPDRLRNIYDPPILLYVQGRMPQFDGEVAVAMVGLAGASRTTVARQRPLMIRLRTGKWLPMCSVPGGYSERITPRTARSS